MKKPERKFRVADSVLLEFSGKVIEYLPEDLPLFTDFDPDLNAEKASLLETTYDSALTFGTDDVAKGVLKKLTENLSARFRYCIGVYKEVRYFAKKAFGDSPAIMKQFGLTSYRKARVNQAKMVVFMHELSEVSEKYREGLLTAGLKETVLNDIKSTAVDLEKANITQEIGKGARSEKTEDRVNLLNSLYDILLELSEAAKMVFADNPLKRERYILPHNRSIGGGNDEG